MANTYNRFGSFKKVKRYLATVNVRTTTPITVYDDSNMTIDYMGDTTATASRWLRATSKTNGYLISHNTTFQRGGGALRYDFDYLTFDLGTQRFLSDNGNEQAQPWNNNEIDTYSGSLVIAQAAGQKALYYIRGSGGANALLPDNELYFYIEIEKNVDVLV